MPATTRKHWQPVLTLLLITPFLTELLSNNVTFSIILNPINLFLLATIGYGFPVLLIRDFAVRRGYGLCQIVVLGLAFGIWNEGIIAKTLLRQYPLPIDLFNFYGITFHIALPWTFLICTWHAMHAVVYPALIVHFCFPTHRSEPWLSRTGSVVITIITLTFGALIYYGNSPEAPAGTTSQLLVFITAAILLALIASLLPRTPVINPGGPFQWVAIRHGFSLFLAAFFIPILFAYYQIPALLFVAYFVVLIGSLLYYFDRKPALNEKPALLFMLGDQTCLATFGLIAAWKQESYERMSSSIMFLAIFLFAIGWLRKTDNTSYHPIGNPVSETDSPAISRGK